MDVVITTHGFLRQRFIDSRDYKSWFWLKDLVPSKYIAVPGYSHRQTTSLPFDKSGSQWEPSSIAVTFYIIPTLHSSWYERANKRFHVILVDESQHAKRVDSLFNQSIRSLPYRHAVLLSGTPLHNTWKDVCGQMALLPGGQAFLDVKRGFYNTPQKAVDDPNSPANMFMRILLSATIIARPKSTLDLPPMARHTVQVDFAGCWAQLETIRGLVTSSKRLLSQAAGLGDSRDSRWLKTRAFQKLMRAQQHAACPLTVHAAKLPAATVIKFERYLVAKEIPQGTSLNHLTEAHYVEFRAFWEVNGNVANIVGNPNDNNVVQSHGDTQEGFQYANDQNDGDTRSNPSFTAEWKSNLRHADSRDVFSPRATSIVETVRGITTNYPGERG
ncbi:unnamed protein product [Clonostachys chloroleuca]|uniref:SNF2 N-terminal domain-containing protein n=1 Tax=Clonostachys chloroleuca TaxID=1926264 RepID=A0AA35ME98_9HYPO|nr:unnamed protein product [Clonostachys chloroleuca]